MSNDPTWQDALTPHTTQEFVDANLAALEDAGSRLNGWSDDAPQRALVEGESRAESEMSVLIAQLARTASPATAEHAGDSWVDAVMGWFDIERIRATRAVWMIELIWNNGVTFQIDATNAGQIQGMSANGTIFLCTQASPVIFNVGNLYQAQVQFTAREAGVNISADSFQTLISAPSGLEVLSPIEGGDQDLVTAARTQETSADLIRRGLGRWGVIGPSTDSAQGSAGWTRTSLDYLIPFYAPTVTRWSVDDANPLGPGTVLVTLANETGPATSQEIADVYAGLNSLDVKPVGSGEITVQGATPFPLTINVTLQTDGTVDAAVTEAAAEAALATLASKFPIHGLLTPSLVNAILMGAPVQTAAVETGTTDVTIQLELPGFAGVEYISSTDFTSDASLGMTEVLVLTANVTAVV